MNKDQLSLAGKMGGSAIKHRWTEAEREIVRCDYSLTNISAQDIAERLGVTLWAVKGQVHFLGLCKLRSGRKAWDDKQDDILRELLPRYTPNGVAERMGRSVNSIIVRSKRLGLSRRSRDDWYTKREVMEIFGVDHKRVQSFIDSGALKASYHNGNKPQQRGMSMWHIERSDIYRFLRHYPEELNGRNVDLIQIVEILAGLDFSR